MLLRYQKEQEKIYVNTLYRQRLHGIETIIHTTSTENFAYQTHRAGSQQKGI